MQLALIPPFSKLNDIRKTEYQLCLAHLALRNREYYAKYEQSVQAGNLVILDNGAFEGSLVDAKALCQLAVSLDVYEVVIPDAMRSKDQTIEMAKQFRELEFSNTNIRHAFVIQGNTGWDLTECLEWANQQDWIDTIMIPRHVAETTGQNGARLALATQSYKDNPNQEIHLLGASPLWTFEFKAAAERGFIRGMDTSMPYVYGYHEASLFGPEVLNRPDDYFNLQFDTMQYHYVDMNVKEMINGLYNR